VGQYFDLIVGTSTGGIIALDLGLEISCREILAFYEEHGPAIFSGSAIFEGIGFGFVQNTIPCHCEKLWKQYSEQRGLARAHSGW
jgi:patatin-like phospholipase/acyl hydrolase